MNEKPKLREVRKSQNLSVAELSRQTGLHPTTIFDLEGGRRCAYPKYRRLLSEALGVPAAELFGVERSTSQDHQQGMQSTQVDQEGGSLALRGPDSYDGGGNG